VRGSDGLVVLSAARNRRVSTETDRTLATVNAFIPGDGRADLAGKAAVSQSGRCRVKCASTRLGPGAHPDLLPKVQRCVCGPGLVPTARFLCSLKRQG